MFNSSLLMRIARPSTSQFIWRPTISALCFHSNIPHFKALIDGKTEKGPIKSKKFDMTFEKYKEIKEIMQKNSRNFGIGSAITGSGGVGLASYLYYPQMFDVLDPLSTGLPLNIDPLALSIFVSLGVAYNAYRIGSYLQRKLAFLIMQADKKQQYYLREADFDARVTKYHTDFDKNDPTASRVTTLSDYARWLRRQRQGIRNTKKRLASQM